MYATIPATTSELRERPLGNEGKYSYGGTASLSGGRARPMICSPAATMHCAPMVPRAPAPSQVPPRSGPGHAGDVAGDRPAAGVQRRRLGAPVRTRFGVAVVGKPCRCVPSARSGPADGSWCSADMPPSLRGARTGPWFSPCRQQPTGSPSGLAFIPPKGAVLPHPEVAHSSPGLVQSRLLGVPRDAPPWRDPPVVAERLPLSEARRAHELLGSTAATGKIMLVI